MGPTGALLMLVAPGLAAVVVLRDVAAYDRPPREERPPREKRERPVPEPELVTIVEPLPYDTGSMLARLAATEQDERSAARRVVAALVLLTLTLVTAVLVGAGIYRGLT